MEKVKIILDADVLLHFAKAGRLNMLPEILPEYEHVVLSTVYDEIGSVQNQLDNQIFFLKNISKETFNPTGEMMIEYARLLQTFGKGESACMAYCRYTHNVIGSSNLKDIKEYCEKLEHFKKQSQEFDTIQSKLETKKQDPKLITGHAICQHFFSPFMEKDENTTLPSYAI